MALAPIMKIFWIFFYFNEKVFCRILCFMTSSFEFEISLENSNFLSCILHHSIGHKVVESFTIFDAVTRFRDFDVILCSFPKGENKFLHRLRLCASFSESELFHLATTTRKKKFETVQFPTQIKENVGWNNNTLNEEKKSFSLLPLFFPGNIFSIFYDTRISFALYDGLGWNIVRDKAKTAMRGRKKKFFLRFQLCSSLLSFRRYGKKFNFELIRISLELDINRLLLMNSLILFLFHFHRWAIISTLNISNVNESRDDKLWKIRVHILYNRSFMRIPTLDGLERFLDSQST